MCLSYLLTTFFCRSFDDHFDSLETQGYIKILLTAIFYWITFMNLKWSLDDTLLSQSLFCVDKEN